MQLRHRRKQGNQSSKLQFINKMGGYSTYTSSDDENRRAGENERSRLVSPLHNREMENEECLKQRNRRYNPDDREADCCSVKTCSPLRERIFLLLTEPESSPAATLLFVSLVVMIFASVLIMMLQTMPRYQHTPNSCTFCGGDENFGVDDDSENVLQDDTVPCECPPVPHHLMTKAQDVLVQIFSVEWILRVLFFTPSSEASALEAFKQTFSFIFEWGQIIDALAIFPYYLEHMNKSNSFLPLRLLRFARVFRILRLGQHHEILNSLVNVLRKSFSSVSVLVVALLFGASFFGSMLFWAEKGHWKYTDLTDPPSYQFVRMNESYVYDLSPFRSIPDCFWWFIVTATTVGYGDTYPITGQGKIIASFAMLLGVLVIAFPVSVFSDFWHEELERRGKIVTANSSHLSSPVESMESFPALVEKAADGDGNIQISKQDLLELLKHLDTIKESRKDIKNILLSCKQNIGSASTPSPRQIV
mmetsp:Transcript_21216/g.27343  ORF Transcript_21216/g.27343 Transcript_21216/m.27343 type:complete len:475 (-) Transcript_21216:811-2235(-)